MSLINHQIVKRGAILVLLGLAAICCATSGAIAQKAGKHSTATDPLLASAESFINSIRTLKASFVQAATNGVFAKGTIYIERPGNLRIEYEKPATLQVYADGIWLIYVDEELKEVSQLPLSATPASFLVRDNFRFSDGLTVLKIEKRNRTLRIKLARKGEEDSGTLTLILSEQANAFRGWTVTDTQGVRTTVSLLSPIINQPISKKVFVFTPPDWSSPSDAQE